MNRNSRTGQKDSKGNDTHEGDVVFKILEDDSEHTCIIRYSEKCARFVFCPIAEEWDFDRDVVDNPHDRERYAVVGNINKNPEKFNLPN
tara:strand:- start:75 stop:341 length:267 start_codon:yes stop_codon:yes gene_type:complete